MNRPLRIGLTGGIASGKSTVARLFGELGIEVIDTDIIAREVVEPGQDALAEIHAAFGERVLNTDGSLNRGAMRQLVFADDEARRKLEGIVHPRIQERTRARIEAATGPYVVVVVPLLVESSLKDRLDRILVVDCSEATQIERLLARDAETEAQARRMLAAQSTREQRLEIADDVIHNDSTLAAISAQVSAIHDRYLAIAHLPDDEV